MVLARDFMAGVKDQASLGRAYRAWLRQVQPHCPWVEEGTRSVLVDASSSAFSGYFKSEDRVEPIEDEAHPFMMYPDVKERMEMFCLARSLLQEKEPLEASMFSMLMHTVLFDTNGGWGGTSVNPNYIGVMGVHRDVCGDFPALVESLLHECTHNALFLDEHRYQHYTDYGLLLREEHKLESPF